MTAPEFTAAATREVENHEQEYFTVQHKLPGVEEWHQESPPLPTAEEAVHTLEAHSGWYQPGHIRAVKKVVRTTTEVYVTVLHST